MNTTFSFLPCYIQGVSVAPSYIIAIVIAVLIMMYLVYALVKPEKF